MSDEALIKSRIERVRRLAHTEADMHMLYEAASISQSIIHDTLGIGHPVMRAIEEGVKTGGWQPVLGACKAVLALYDDGALKSPMLRIAHEVEGGVLDIAESQAKAADLSKDSSMKALALSIAAFLAGAALEDALRRLCDINTVPYDNDHSAIAKLQGLLYQPSVGIAVISQSESKQITSWGDTRNKADHGKFSEITQTEVTIMIIGVRAFIDKHLG